MKKPVNKFPFGEKELAAEVTIERVHQALEKDNSKEAIEKLAKKYDIFLFYEVGFNDYKEVIPARYKEVPRFQTVEVGIMFHEDGTFDRIFKMHVGKATPEGGIKYDEDGSFKFMEDSGGRLEPSTDPTSEVYGDYEQVHEEIKRLDALSNE